MTPRVAILGAGSWGTTLALHLARGGADVWLWDIDDAHLARLAAERENTKHLPGEAFPDSIRIAHGLGEALDVDVALFVVPSGGMRELADRVRALRPEWPALPVSASKGFEFPGGLRMSQVLEAALPPPASRRVVVLAGPSLAREVARGLPATLVAAGPEPEARAVQSLMNGRNLRVYTNPDAAGVELAGALKNVIAIAAGIIDGLEWGDNAKGALLARGLSEMVRLGEALGARAESFYGLCGVGDLATTSGSGLSRNHQVGIGLARGRALQDILADLGMVAEGVPTSRAALELAGRVGVELPITREVVAVLFEGKRPDAALRDLMGRELKSEYPSSGPAPAAASGRPKREML